MRLTVLSRINKGKKRVAMLAESENSKNVKHPEALCESRPKRLCSMSGSAASISGKSETTLRLISSQMNVYYVKGYQL